MSTSDLKIARCSWCNEPLPPAKTTGRPRLYCSDACKLAAFRNRRHEPSVEVRDIAPDELPELPALSADELVARAIAEGRTLGAAFIRLGREARAPLAWRCEEVGIAILSTIDEHFEA